MPGLNKSMWLMLHYNTSIKKTKKQLMGEVEMAVQKSIQIRVVGIVRCVDKLKTFDVSRSEKRTPFSEARTYTYTWAGLSIRGGAALSMRS